MRVQSTTFEIYPALDIQHGEIARTPQSSLRSIEDALAAYAIPGIQWLHLVDLDLAYQLGSNHQTIKQIIESTTLKVQLSGGIKDMPAFENAMKLKPQRINLAPDFLAHKNDLREVLLVNTVEISCAIDVADNRIVSRATGEDFGEIRPVIDWLSSNGCEQIILTDSAKDGRLQGVNVELYEQIVKTSPMRVIASGGVTTIEDILNLMNVSVGGAVVGAALHQGTIDLTRALKVLEVR